MADRLNQTGFYFCPGCSRIYVGEVLATIEQVAQHLHGCKGKRKREPRTPKRKGNDRGKKHPSD